MRTLALLLMTACFEPATAPPVARTVVLDSAPPPPVAPPAPAPPPIAPRYAATHLLVAYKGAAAAPQAVQRSRTEAQALAAELHARVRGGEDLSMLARAHSDDASAPRGGALGVSRPGLFDAAFEDAIAKVHPGEIADVVETRFGFHVLRREPVAEHKLAHIRFDVGPEEDPDDVLARAKQVRERLVGGASFAALAADHSDDEATAEHGGSLGLIGTGQLPPDLETILFALPPGQLSEPIRTRHGWHLFRRD